jgi:hypothetical protein
MIKLWNRDPVPRVEGVIDLTAVLEGPRPEPVPVPLPPVLELSVERRGHHLVLCVENLSESVARHLVVRALEPQGAGVAAGVVDEHDGPVHLRPHEVAEYRVYQPEGCAPGVRCRVSWRDGGGQHIEHHVVELLSAVG